MKHPTPATLALHAGGDLGMLDRWRTDRHLAQCERCREEVEAFAGTLEILPDLAETPEVPWSRLAAEMKANIRLGLAAGECVKPGETPLRQSLFSGARAVVALASVAALLLTVLFVERPAPPPRADGVVVQSTVNGIQIREGGQALRLMHAGAHDVTYSVGAQGSLRARFVDPETGYVTINNVYAE
ncbi:MAG TPA: hypothetical protein VJ732_07860 [Bryobacteraceae bacterium]|nr:hypothetical protein [Bryobacteraceae bacterium]